MSGIAGVSGRSQSWKAEALVVGGFVLAVTAWHVMTIPGGYGWGDDFAMYIAHARNLVEGQPFSATGYIVNPDNLRIGPSSYPPAYPLLLTIPYALRGLDLAVFQSFTALFIAPLLIVLYVMVRAAGGRAVAALVVLLTGLNPYVWNLRGHIISELPFMVFLFAGLLVTLRMDQRGGSPQRAFGLAVLAGALFYAAYATRSLGLLVGPAVAAADLVRYRRLRLPSLALLAVFGLGVLLQNLALPILKDYGAIVSTAQGGGGLLAVLQTIAANSVGLPRAVSWTWQGSLHPIIDWSVTILMYGLAGWGAWRRWSAPRSTTVLDWFLLAYAGAFLILPIGNDVRRMLPVLPIVFFYVAVGAMDAWSRVRVPRKPLLAAASAGIVALGYVGGFRDYAGSVEPEGVTLPQTQDLFAFMRGTPEESVVIFFKPRALALFTDRSASGYANTEDWSVLCRHAGSIGARYLIATRGQDPDEHVVEQFAAALRPQPEVVYANALFSVYALPSPAADLNRCGTAPSSTETDAAPR